MLLIAKDCTGIGIVVGCLLGGFFVVGSCRSNRLATCHGFSPINLLPEFIRVGRPIPRHPYAVRTSGRTKAHQVELVVNAREDLCNCLAMPPAREKEAPGVSSELRWTSSSLDGGETFPVYFLTWSTKQAASFLPWDTPDPFALSPDGNGPSCSGVGDHTARTHDLGQIASWHYSGWLVVDTALEASGAPIHKLNGALGLDGRHCRIHILGHHVT